MKKEAEMEDKKTEEESKVMEDMERIKHKLGLSAQVQEKSQPRSMDRSEECFELSPKKKKKGGGFGSMW